MTTVSMVKEMGYIKDAILSLEASSRELLKLGGIQAIADRIVEAPDKSTSKAIERRPKLVISDGADEVKISIDEFPDLVKPTIDLCVKRISADLDHARGMVAKKMREIEL